MMSKKGVRGSLLALMTVVLMLCVLAMTTLFSLRVSAADDDPTTPIIGSGSTVTGIRITDSGVDGPAYTGSITKDKHVNIEITVFEERTPKDGAFSTLQPTAVLNTASFVYYSGNDLANVYATPPEIVKDSGGRAIGCTYKLRFMEIVYTGTGNVFACDFYYSNDETLPIQNYSIELNQCVPYEAPSSSDSSSSDSSSSTVIGTDFVLKSVNFGGSDVNAGSSFDLNCEILATSGTYSLNNVTVEVTPSKEFSIAAGASNLYIGSVRPGGSFGITVPLTASATVDEGSYKVDFTVSGINSNDGIKVSATISVTVPIVQPERFEIANVQVPDFLMAGMDDGSGFSTVNLRNMGKGAIYNVVVSVEGEGLTTDLGSQFIGNIAAGTESGADFSIIASMPGMIDARIVVAYENGKGEQKQLIHEFTIDVQDMGGGDGDWSDPFPMPEPEPEPEGGVPVWLWLVIGLIVVVGGIVVIVIVVKKRKAKKAAALDDDYNDGEDEF